MRIGALAAVACAAALAAPAPPAHAAPLRILATGDSMLMLTDRVLRRTLEPTGRARVISAIHAATGLTKPWLLDWPRHAATQVRRHRPDVVLVTMGANDVHPIDGAPCCGGRRWVARYAAHIERLTKVWRRGGVRRVYWLTLPIQAHARLAPVFTGVNAAIARARVAVFDVRPIVNPGGRYVHEVEVAPGVVEQIRSADGVHLWWAGARLVAGGIIERLRADGLLR